MKAWAKPSPSAHPKLRGLPKIGAKRACSFVQKVDRGVRLRRTPLSSLYAQTYVARHIWRNVWRTHSNGKAPPPHHHHLPPRLPAPSILDRIVWIVDRGTDTRLERDAHNMLKKYRIYKEIHENET